MKPYLLNNVPEELWERLRTDAASRELPAGFSSKRTERSGTSLNNVVCEILARRYELAFEPTKRATFDQSPSRRSLYLRLPEDIADGVREEAGDGSFRSVIIRSLAEFYGVDVTHRRQQRVKHGRPRGRKVRR